jgi:hypothetical protein
MGVSAGSTISELLRCSRFDVLPLDGIEDEVREHLATDVKVTVAASPRKGLEATLELSERLPRRAIRWFLTSSRSTRSAAPSAGAGGR